MEVQIIKDDQIKMEIKIVRIRMGPKTEIKMKVHPMLFLELLSIHNQLDPLFTLA
ncbi:hypothetical protein [Enterococcus bulliens]